MKFWEINKAVKEEMQLDPGLVTDAERARYFNDCLDNIANLQLIEVTVTQLAVVAQYPTVPVGLGKVRSLYWNDIKLVVLQSSRDVVSSGNPVGYIWEADAVRLYPKPASAGNLRWTYTGTPPYCTELIITDETSTAAPALPSGWHTLLVDYSCYRSHRKNGNILMSSQYKRDYDSGLAGNIRAYISALNAQIVDTSSPEASAGGDFYGYYG